MSRDGIPKSAGRSERPVPTFEGRPLADPDEPIFDQGLGFDVQTLIDRRRVLKLIGMSAAGLTVVACASPLASALATATAVPSVAPAGTAAASTAAAAECDVIPEETGGPYPGDGSNGPDVLSQSGVVRQDIRSSFGGMSGTAEGIPLTIKLAIQDAAKDCAPLAAAAVYAWHCDREGRYSLYSQGVTDQNYLRGVQPTDADGVATFTSIFPACYSGRWPHVHFEVYPSLEKATDDANKIATSQIALPKDICDAVYATAGYEQSVSNLSRVSLSSDNVFGNDDGVHQVGTVTGSVDTGYTVTLAVPVKSS